MDNIQYYVVVDRSTVVDDIDIAKIDEVKVEIRDTKLPFSDKYIDLYLISDKKAECEEYIKKLNVNIQKFFYIEQVGSEIQYTAFIDILGFSNYIKTHITNDDEAEELYEKFNEIIDYLQHESKDEINIKNAAFFKNITLKYSWISDTFVISTQYMNEIKKENKNIIKSMMILRLSIIIASIHHFVASEFGLTCRGSVSSKYSCITNNFILGEGIAEAASLEKYAIYPRVIFEKSIICDEVYKIMRKQHGDHELGFISKDSDDYYFVNYLAILLYIPPMIGKTIKIPDDKIEEHAIQLKMDVIKKYHEIVENGLKIPKEEVKNKYIWLDNYLSKVLSKKEFQEIIDKN